MNQSPSDVDKRIVRPFMFWSQLQGIGARNKKEECKKILNLGQHFSLNGWFDMRGVIPVREKIGKLG